MVLFKTMATITNSYKTWLKELKQHIYAAQIKAALKVNAELLAVYWHLGCEILDKEGTIAMERN